MNRYLLLCGLSLIAATQAFAGFTVPSSVFDLGQLSEAMDEAREERKGLAFVLSNKTTSCPLCVNTTLESFKRLKRHSTVVYLDTSTAWREVVSPLVVASLRADWVGKIIPKVVITSPDMAELWATMRYTEIKSGDHFGDIQKQVEALIDHPDAPKPKAPEFLFLGIVNDSGRGYYASITKVDGEMAHLKLRDGKAPVTVPLAKLVPNAAAYAKAIGAAAAKRAMVKIADEDWTGSNGRVIRAAFVSLENDTVTLRNDSGKTYQFPLTRLHPDSQQRAKELAKATE